MPGRCRWDLIISSSRQSSEVWLSAGLRAAGLIVRCRNAIPHSRGLGLIGRSGGRWTGGRQRPSRTSGLRSTQHSRPDSAVVGIRGSPRQCRRGGARWCGGLVVGESPKIPTAPHRRSTRRCHCVCTPISGCLPAIPEVRSSTAETRVLLPAQVSHHDARFNLSRAALLVVALTERPDLLMVATEDVLHQPQRAAAMPASAEYLQLLRRYGIAAVLSGAGPAVLALSTKPELPSEVLEYGTANGFTIREMTVGDGVRWSSGSTIGA